MPPERDRIAVALHDIEPATFERCALIRDWLDDHGVDRVTLLVIPARDLHPLGERSPGDDPLAARAPPSGDSIAQHGFQHERLRRGPISRRALRPSRNGRSAEFVGLDGDETRRAVDAGWRVLKLAGIEPDGFVAPAYAYTPALRRVLPREIPLVGRACCACTAPSRRQRTRAHRLVPAWGMGTESRMRAPSRPPLIRAGSLVCGRTMRLDLHPADLEHPRHMLALEWVLGRAGRRREAITYDELLAAPMSPAGRTRMSLAHGATARLSAGPRAQPRTRAVSAGLGGLEQRGFEGAHARRCGVPEVPQREQVLDRAQQREVVVRFLARGGGLDER